MKGEELEGAPEPIIPANIDIDNLDILDIAPEEIARQMTLLDFELFTRIELKEWFEAPKNNPNLTPNINAFIKRFNEVSCTKEKYTLKFCEFNFFLPRRADGSHR